MRYRDYNCAVRDFVRKDQQKFRNNPGRNQALRDDVN